MSEASPLHAGVNGRGLSEERGWPALALLPNSQPVRAPQEQRMDFFWVPYRSGAYRWSVFLKRFAKPSKASAQA